ncbi:MAG: UDP-N-acetylmuramoyl-L-alanyl-D-glutamate--2,6-diaminopimelate ligase [Frankiaceae bacterium]
MNGLRNQLASPGVTPSLRPSRPEAHALSQVLDALPGRPCGVETAGSDPVVTGITLDSRCVAAGDLYVALPGAHTHGARHCEQAVRSGAVAVLTDAAGAAAARACGVAAVVVADPRAALGALASAVYGHPCRRLRLLGVTGTNGKTTVAYLLEAGLRAEGQRTGLVGTVETRLGDDAVPSVRTTPEATDLHALFAVMVERGVTAAAMEVSSHALAFGRAGGLSFAGVAFTNLTQDHLDFHADMAHYFQAKSSLFRPEMTALSVVNADDAYGRQLLAVRPPHPVTFGVRERADWRAVDVHSDAAGSRFAVHGPAGLRTQVSVRLPGAFNVSNTLAALALLVCTGTPVEAAVEGVGRLAGVPGRMERVDAGQPFAAYVDYAHTPAAVVTLLDVVRRITPGRVIVVLGCGGDRDAGKRPLMGAAAARGADLVVLTNDNPRSEDPATILAAMAVGARAVPATVRATVLIEPDRAGAIALAVSRARPGDTVVIAGKGHEWGQEQGGVVTPFDDREALRSALSSGSAA